MADVLRILAECPSMPFAAMARELEISRHQFYNVQQLLMARERLSTDGRTVLGQVPPLDDSPLELTPEGLAAIEVGLHGCDNVSH
jgi:hypothetical protein